MEMSHFHRIGTKARRVIGRDCDCGGVTIEQLYGEMLCDSVFQFYRPEGRVQLEVVFVHDLEHGNSADVHWNTWLVGDGTSNEVWPKTWLPAEFPNAQVFALKYDASIKQTPSNGRMDLYILGEKLVQELVDFGGIGQNGVPVVFVCHGFGGLVAKQIIVSAKHLFSQCVKARNLLLNIGALLFYSTPHHGSHLANYMANIFKDGGKGPLVENIEVFNTEISRLNQEFEEEAKRQTWYFNSTAGTHETPEYGAMVVEEASSRYEGSNYLPMSRDHFDICKPKTKKDSSFLWLIKCLKEVMVRKDGALQSKPKSLVPKSHVKLKAQEKTVRGMLQNEHIVGLVGMGGIGKTTLAKAVYQSICNDFEKCSYLDDVKSKSSLDEVLVVLLQDFGIKEQKSGRLAQLNDLKDSKEILIEELKMYVHQQKVLVVVDDIGKRANLEYLLDNMGHDSAKKESRVVVTCRNWQELKDLVKVGGKHEVQFMSSSEDIELFSYHAFKGARTEEQSSSVLRAFLSKDSSEQIRFTSIPDSIGELVNLSTLQINSCTGLTSLPSSIGKLVKLAVLDLADCGSLTSVPDSIGELVNLSNLQLCLCTGLTSLPSSIGKLVKLARLDLTDCGSLTSVPDSIGELVNLSTLRISSCTGLTNLPSSIGKLVNLAVLHLTGCGSLTSIPDSIGELVNLSTLRLDSCTRLTSLPSSIAKLVNLARLDLADCGSLTSVPYSIGELVNLSTLRLDYCTGLTSLPSSIGKLVKLARLDLTGCRSL